jgi:3-phosphoshikimate 1-carboxyvinyltransferase
MSARTIAPARGGLRGTTAVPVDKSIAHRGLLLGAIAEGTTVLHGVPEGEDNRATLAACRALGVDVRVQGGQVAIDGRGLDGLRAPLTTIDCANSGTTMRLLAGLLAGRPFGSRLDGDASLRRRPMRRVIEPLSRMGAAITSEGDDGRPPLAIAGRALQAAAHVLPIASAQVKSALHLAGLQANGETRVKEPAQSRDHTERMLAAFGCRVRRDGTAVTVAGPQSLTATEIRLPGDFSSAAFPIVAALVVPGSELRITGVGLNPTRTGLLDALTAMGADVAVAPEPTAAGAEPYGTIVARASALSGTRVDGELMLRAIDEFPILCVAAACARGTTELADAAELRVKESDRVAAMASLLGTLGVRVRERKDGLVIEGGTGLGGGRIDPAGDHRIAMAAAVAALASRDGVTVDGAACADVSFPGFYDLLERLRA